MSKTGMIFNIQRFSIYDGPGVRTTIFFKGCNLKCKWCHNPEAISFKKQIEFFPQNCIGCGACFNICPNKVHEMDENETHRINRDNCNGCFLCADVCYNNALVGVGTKVDTDYLFKSILTDELYYKNSSGGVTFSGGECMLQEDFLQEILIKCKNKGIHTAVDTAGCVPWKSFEKVIPYTDLFLYDVKAADTDRHKQLTGMDNYLILENLKKLSELRKEIYIRVPYIVGCNDDQIEKIAQIIKPLNIARIELMAYHKLGNSKYTALDIPNELEDIEIPTEDMVEKAIAIFHNYGLNAFKL